MISLSKYAKQISKDKNTLQKFLEKKGVITVNGKNIFITDLGKKLGFSIGMYMGNFYVQGKEELFDKIFLGKKQKPIINNLKPGNYKTVDGHLVRSRAEVMIDDWLYNNNIVHAYEKNLPVEELLLSDFYLPEGKVYIEFWGLEGNNNYDKRKKEKLEIYKKYNINLIEINDKELENLDYALPKKLLKFGIKTY